MGNINVTTMTQIFLTSLAPSWHWAFSLSILNLGYSGSIVCLHCKPYSLTRKRWNFKWKIYMKSQEFRQFEVSYLVVRTVAGNFSTYGRKRLGLTAFFNTFGGSFFQILTFLFLCFTLLCLIFPDKCEFMTVRIHTRGGNTINIPSMYQKYLELWHELSYITSRWSFKCLA